MCCGLSASITGSTIYGAWTRCGTARWRSEGGNRRMAMDTATSLLFSIGAETDDAEGNIQRFRALMGKDLDALEAEFADWSHEVFGNLTSVSGALTAMAAAGAAAV